MTGFSLDFENTLDGGQIEDGTYEVIITFAAEDATKNGAEYADFRLTIRNDINQKFKNMIIFEKLWKAKATGKYYMPMFNTIGKAAQLQKGKTYNSMKGLLDDYVGKPLKVTVKNEESEYNGQTYTNLNVKKWEQTAFPNVQHVYKKKDDTPSNGGQTYQNPLPPLEINDDDLPF